MQSVLEYCSAAWCSAAYFHHYWIELLLFRCLRLSGRAGLLSIKGNKSLRSMGYRSNPKGALLQAEWPGVGGEDVAIWLDFVRSRDTSTTEKRPIFIWNVVLPTYSWLNL